MSSDPIPPNPPEETLQQQGIVILEEPPSDFAVDKALSNELMGLSLDARNAFEEEMHGVRCGSIFTKESPQILEQSLREFDHLLNVRKESAEALQGREVCVHGLLLRNVIRTYCYGNNNCNNDNNCKKDSSDNSSPPQKDCYLNDPEVRLRFLRRECFAVEPAVNTFVNFFEFLQDLFGSFVAERPIEISDFSMEEELFLRNSRTQYLPFRDQSGRRVMVSVGCNNFDVPIAIRFKILMFMHWIVSKDVETQCKGIVMVTWPFDESERGNCTWEKSIRPCICKDMVAYHHRYYNSMPVRIVSLQHYYKDTPFFKALAALYVFHGLRFKRQERRMKFIYRAHFGEETELRYQITNYGIPETLLPMTSTGKVKTDKQSSWVNMLLSKANQERNNCPGTTVKDEIVECPQSADVVFRKGRLRYICNPGNMYYRELIMATNEQHAGAGRKEKGKITWTIVDKIESKGGRFLEWSIDREMWFVLKDRKIIREKIASAFKQYNRDHASCNRKSNKQMDTTKQTKRHPNESSHKLAAAEVDLTKGSSIQLDPPFSTSATNPILPEVRNDTTMASTAAPRQSHHARSEGENSSKPYLFLQPEHRTYDGSSKRRIPIFCATLTNVSESTPTTRTI